MSDEKSTIRRGLAGLAALVVAAASLAVLPQPAHTIGDQPRDEQGDCLNVCDPTEGDWCCTTGGFGR